MHFDLNELKKWADKLPDSLTAHIVEEEDGGYSASIKEFPGVHTQGESPLDLMVMINDAVQDWLDIPEKLKSHMPQYIIEII